MERQKLKAHDCPGVIFLWVEKFLWVEGSLWVEGFLAGAELL